MPFHELLPMSGNTPTVVPTDSMTPTVTPMPTLTYSPTREWEKYAEATWQDLGLVVGGLVVLGLALLMVFATLRADTK